ncbi:MAG: tetratricopeptide repeat protein [Calditrichae bacterium]|nr:tetratricopeptide repeat protein [Calditrichia bacterium]
MNGAEHSERENRDELLSGMPLWVIALVSLCALILLNCSAGRAGRNKSPDRAKAAYNFYYLAEDEIRQNRFPQALALLDSAVYYNPGLANFHQIRGWLWEQLDQPDSAIAAYETCLIYKSAHPDVLSRLSKLYLDAGDHENAASYLKHLVKNYPDSTDGYLKLGIAYYLKGTYPLAIDNLKSYQRMSHPPRTVLWKWLGLCLYQTGEYQKSVEALERYTALIKDDPVALKHLGFAKYALGDYHEAISHLNAAEVYMKRDPEIYLYRARYFLRFDKPEVAREQLNLVLAFDSLNVDILFELGHMLYDRGEYSAGKPYFEKIVQIRPEFWPAYRYLGFLAEREEKYLQAQQYYKIYLDNTFEHDAEVMKRVEAIISRGEKK